MFFFVLSLYFLSWADYATGAVLVGVVVTLFCLGNILLKALPWHVAKRFTLP